MLVKPSRHSTYYTIWRHAGMLWLASVSRCKSCIQAIEEEGMSCTVRSVPSLTCVLDATKSFI